MFGIPNDENCDHSTGNTWLQHEDEWCSRVAQSKEGSWSDLCFKFVDRLSRNDNERGHKEHDRPIISPSLGSLSRRDYSSASLESHPAWCCIQEHILVDHKLVCHVESRDWPAVLSLHTYFVMKTVENDEPNLHAAKCQVVKFQEFDRKLSYVHWNYWKYEKSECLTWILSTDKVLFGNLCLVESS